MPQRIRHVPSPHVRLLCTYALIALATATLLPLAHAARPPVHHELAITLIPETHELIAHDTVRVPQDPERSSTLAFSLNRHLTIDDVALNGARLSPSDFRTTTTDQATQRVQVTLSGPHPSLTEHRLSLRYHGHIDDTPSGSVGLRFVRPDETTGHIGPEGIYLTSETRWYPAIAGSLLTARMEVTVPTEWESVTQGEATARRTTPQQTVTTWNIASPSEALTLAANRFVRQEREHGGMKLATYLFPSEAALAADYLDAAARYVSFYSTLLGPYPFPKFAVVENFFPSGIGLPSFTLLGSRVVKRGYTQPYSLGHEIVHSWMGNSVFNHFDTGNWVEGLTTYLANYYYDETHEPSKAAIAHRRRMAIEYNLFGRTPDEYPVRAFHHKQHRIDNAIGYQKTAMIFHMLRRELGDEVFFSSLRELVRRHTGRYADWATLHDIFSQTAGRDMSWFFQQWLDRTGAPTFSIHNAHIMPDPEQPDQFRVTFTVAQREPAYRVRLPIVATLPSNTKVRTDVMVTAPEQRITITLQGRPSHITVDADVDTLRTLTRAEIAPLLNSWVTDHRRAILFDPDGPHDERDAYDAVRTRVSSEFPNLNMDRSDKDPFPTASLLILRNPRTSALGQQALNVCAPHVTLAPNSITIQGERFSGSGISWLVSCPHPSSPEHTVTMFHGFSAHAIQRVARLLFFYGWDSYIVFQDGRVISRGLFPPARRPLHVPLLPP